jgi:hypothetical protein
MEIYLITPIIISILGLAMAHIKERGDHQRAQGRQEQQLRSVEARLNGGDSTQRDIEARLGRIEQQLARLEAMLTPKP